MSLGFDPTEEQYARIEEFSSERGISILPDTPPPVSEGINAICRTLEIMTETHSRTQHSHFAKHPHLCLLHDSFARNHEYASSLFVLCAAGQYPSAEVMSRTLLEASVNQIYKLRSDSNERVTGYFKHHIENERSQLDKWEGSLSGSEESKLWEQEHRNTIRHRRDTLNQYWEYLTLFYKNSDKDITEYTPSYAPNIFERFRNIGAELTYRTYYADLCSQTHNDAEDSFNRLPHRLTNLSFVWDMNQVEIVGFSLRMAMVATRYHLMATHELIKDVGEPIDEIEVMINRLAELDGLLYLHMKTRIDEISQNAKGGSSTSPSGDH